MTTTLDYGLKEALPFLCDRDRWNVLTALILHSNERNRCYPSLDLLAKEATHGNRNHAAAAKKWLMAHGAFVLVPYGKRFGVDENALPRRQHLYELTGFIQACNNAECDCGGNGRRYAYLYFGNKKNTKRMDGDRIDGDTINGNTMNGESIDGDTLSISISSVSTSTTSNGSASTENIEKRVTAVLAKLADAKIKFSKTDYPNKPMLIKGVIEEHGYKTVMMAIQDAERESAKWWSYVEAKLEAQKQHVMTGEDYISGKYADYIDH